jgi:hypothetical protein
MVLAIVAAGCGDDGGGTEAADDQTAAEAPEWPAPDDPGERADEAGLELERQEHLQIHRHAHLDVFVDGAAVTVPAGIGIVITDPGVQSFPDPAYGGIEQCDDPCISPLHTHDETGILHTESTQDDLLTLGQFFTEWGVTLDEDCVDEYCAPDTEIAVYLDGERYDGDPAAIELDDRLQIAVVVGTPPDDIPDTADFSQV